jgi:DNA gyrase subunit A
MGRATQGVILIGLDEGSKLSGVQRIAENDAQNSEETNELSADSETDIALDNLQDGSKGTDEDLPKP